MRTTLTTEEALAVLPEGDYVHTFRNPAGMMIGAAWKREDIQKAIREADTVYLTGPMARRMMHGIGINHDGSGLFIATDPDALDALDPGGEE